MTSCLMFWGSCFTSFLQVGRGSRRGIYTHQASQRRWGHLIAQTSARDHGSARGCTSHICADGPGHAEIPEDHPTTGLPQHGEHPHTPAVLHHTQHDAKGKGLGSSLPLKWRNNCSLLIFDAYIWVKLHFPQFIQFQMWHVSSTEQSVFFK